jgi:polyisoprenoid-binding protein YceI
MRRLLATIALVAAALALSSCAALNVVTHRVNSDPVDVAAGTYRLDPDHWSVTFDVSHFGFSRYVARFDAMEATLNVVPGAPEQSSVAVTIKAASLNARNAELDKKLIGPELLDAARFPDITFKTTSLKRLEGNKGEMTGALTMHGVSHPVTLDVTFNGGAKNPLTGADTLGFSATGSFDRSRWGLSAWWPAVGNEVRVAIEAEFIKSAL